MLLDTCRVGICKEVTLGSRVNADGVRLGKDTPLENVGKWVALGIGGSEGELVLTNTIAEDCPGLNVGVGCMNVEGDTNGVTEPLIVDVVGGCGVNELEISNVLEVYIIVSVNTAVEGVNTAPVENLDVT